MSLNEAIERGMKGVLTSEKIARGDTKVSFGDMYRILEAMREPKSHPRYVHSDGEEYMSKAEVEEKLKPLLKALPQLKSMRNSGYTYQWHEEIEQTLANFGLGDSDE